MLRASTLALLAFALSSGASTTAVAQAGSVVRDPVTGQLLQGPPDPACRLVLTEPRQWRCPPTTASRGRMTEVTGSLGSVARPGDAVTVGTRATRAGAQVRDPVTGALLQAPADPACRLMLTEPRQWQCPDGTGRSAADPLATGSVPAPAAAGVAGLVRDPSTGQVYQAPNPSCRLLMTNPRQWVCPDTGRGEPNGRVDTVANNPPSSGLGPQPGPGPAPGTGAGPSPSTGTGGGTGRGPSAGPGPSTGGTPGPDHGPQPGPHTGKDPNPTPGTDHGPKPGTDTGPKPGGDTGPKPGDDGPKPGDGGPKPGDDNGKPGPDHGKGGGKGHGPKGNNGIGNGIDGAPPGLQGRGNEDFNDRADGPKANPGGNTPGSSKAQARDGDSGQDNGSNGNGNRGKSRD